MSAPANTAATPLAADLARIQRGALRAAAVGGVLLAVGCLLDTEQFLRSWLLAFLIWLAPALGSLAVVMLHNLTGGSWGFAVRRLLEAGMRNLPVMALLALPLLAGMGVIYADWVHAGDDPIVAAKSAYLNVPFFVLRTVVYFAVWIGFAFAMLRLSARYDRTMQVKALRKMKAFSALGLVAYVSTMSFASFDWAMSLEPHWFSTMYGVHFVVGQVLSAICLAIVVAQRLGRYEPFSRWLERSHFNDLGNLLLAFVMLWAYISFSQFLIVWSGNLPEETPWYLHRLGHGWQAIALVLVLFHFAVPFFVLLSRRSKRNALILARLAGGIFLLRLVDYFWLVAPAFHAGGLYVSWMDVVAPLTLGALWIGLFVRNLRGRPLVSLQDGRLLRQLEEAPGA